ncbi:MAG: DUF1549 domain-containing protein [Armatimonadetes bacterium]|nr:DUF1549 domain-containing protein [Armatimonadota bacterium]
MVLARLRARGLSFSPEADRLTLIRRVALDLTGLPPRPAEIEEFLADTRADAYERMVDRMLASPHYGERWGRHWLDLAGYADSDGNGNEDTVRPYAYKYRDYVIRSLNADKPLDQFVIEQLAGDELTPAPWKNLKPDQIEKLTATGFLRMAVDATGSGGDTEAAANQVVTDTLKIVSSGLLGLSVGCAQCHDHKYDPIPQEDYFRLRAVFEPALNPAHWRRPGQRLVSLYTDAERARAAEVETAVAKLQAAFNEKQARMVDAAFEKELLKHPEAMREAFRVARKTPADKRTTEHKKLFDSNPSLNITPGVLYQYEPKAAEELTRDQSAINTKRAEKPVEEFLAILSEEGPVPATHLHYRGDYRQPKQPVSPGDLTIAWGDGARREIPADDPQRPTTGRRLAWAQALTRGDHRLFNRVLANRIWLHHFGRGIVDTPGDFGKLGVQPTHPELLDWLALELPQQGWSLKKIHRLLLTSTVYRQTSARQGTQDTEAALYSRFPLRRLDAETLRDRVLEATGRLDRTPFGPPLGVSEDLVGQVVVTNDIPRRSIYLQVRRTRPVSFLSTFDAPIMTVNCEKRQSTTSAPQSLMLMNSDFLLKQAGHFAERLRKEAPGDLTQQLARAWQIAYQRLIRPDELEVALRFVRGHQERHRAAVPADKPEPPEKADLAALTHLCQQLLSSNEFLYAD